jgi:hypothetical protein
MYEFLDILTDIITFIVLGIIFNCCYKLVNIIYKIIAINIKKIYGRIKLYYYPIIPMENDIQLNRFYKYVVCRKYDKLYLHIIDEPGNLYKYYNYINLHLSMYKNDIIESLISTIINIRFKNRGNIFSRSLNPFMLCYKLDYEYTKKIIFKYNKENKIKDKDNHITLMLMCDYIAEPYTNKIKELEEKYKILEDHIKYQPDSEIFFELMDSFNKKIKQN